MEPADHDIFRKGLHDLVSIFALAGRMKESHEPHF